MAVKKSKRTEKKRVVYRDSFLRRNAYPLIIFLFSFLLYFNAINNDYNLDDELVTKQHKLTSQGITAIPKIFTSPYYSDDMGYAFDYRPIVHTSFAIEHQLFGESAKVSHFFNIFFYSLLCLILYFVLLNFPRVSSLFAFCASVLFTAHPLHTEIVCSIKNRDEIFSLLFALLALFAALKYQKGDSGHWKINIKYSSRYIPFNIWLPITCLFFLSSLLSKFSGVSFAIIIPLTLIIFFEMSVLRIALMNLMFVVPIFLLCQQISLWSQVKFTLLTFLAPFVFYLPSSQGRKILNSVWRFCKGTVLFGFMNKQAFRIPDKQPPLGSEIEVVTVSQIFRIRSVLWGFFVLLIIIVSFLSEQKAIIGVGLSVLVLLSIMLKQPSVRFWAITAFVLMLFVLSLICAFRNVAIDYIFCLIAAYLVFFWKQKDNTFEPILKFALLFVVIGSVFAHVYLTGQIGMFLAFPLVLISWRFPKTRVPFIILFLLYGSTIIGDLPGFITRPNFIDFRNIVLVLMQTSVLIFLIIKSLYGKGTQMWVSFAIWAYGLVALGDLPYFYNSSNLSQNDSVNITSPQKTQADLIRQKNSYTKAILLFEMNPDRRIDFVESPVDLYSPLSIRIGTSAITVLHYIKNLFIPYPLSFYYGYKYIEPTNIFTPLALLSTAIHLMLLILGVVFFGRYKIISWALIVYLLSVFAISNFLQPVAGIVADRFATIPSLAFCVAFTWIVFRLFIRDVKLSEVAFERFRIGGKLILLLTALAFAVITFNRNYDWKDDLTLFRRDIKGVSQSAQANNLLAIHLINRAFTLNNEPEKQKALRIEAVCYFKNAIEIYPNFFNVSFDLGRTYMLLNMPDSALPYFQKAMALNPNYNETYISIGDVYFIQGKFNEAIRYFEKAVENRPDNYKAYDKLSFVYYKLHEFNKSLEINQKAADRMPALSNPLVNIGRTYIGMNIPDSAVVYFKKALLIEPGNIVAKQMLQQLENQQKY